MNSKETRKYAEKIFKALASTHRLRILRILLNEEGICAKDIADKLELSQPDVSYHLSKLDQAGILGKDKRGTRNCYHLNKRTLRNVGIIPKELLNNNGGGELNERT